MARRKHSSPGAVGWLLLLSVGALTITWVLTPTLGGSTAAGIGVYGMIGLGIVLAVRSLVSAPRHKPSQQRARPASFSISIEPVERSAPVPRQLDVRLPFNGVTLPAGRRVEVVGESHYQDALEQLCGRCEHGVDLTTTAALVPEPGNPYDPNAVAVQIGGRTVGYLARGAAEAFKPVSERLLAVRRSGLCQARIRGGWEREDGDVGNFGVTLDLADPDELLASLGRAATDA
jgi:hypothetical protein